jgi:alkylation response protein AidB-like acyl-CoA dehydrogenase
VRFDLTAEQRALSAALTHMISMECPPSQVRETFDGATGIDEQFWRSLARLGVFGIAVPEAFGGAGQGLLDLAVAAEALGRSAVPGPFLEHAVATLAIAAMASQSQQEYWLTRMIAGEARGTISTLDTDIFWEPDSWATEAGKPLLGTCSTVLNAASADVALVGLAGGFALVKMDDPGVTVVEVEVLDRGRRIARLELDKPAYEPIHAGSDGAARIRDAALILLAADAAGGSAHCLSTAVDYAKTREQFGVTIGQFQAVKHQIANMALAVEPARTLYWYAAHAFDTHAPDTARAAALAKAHLTDTYTSAARSAIEIHGGIGYTWECDMHFWLKRAILDSTLFGTPRVHRKRLADLSGW